MTLMNYYIKLVFNECINTQYVNLSALELKLTKECVCNFFKIQLDGIFKYHLQFAFPIPYL